MERDILKKALGYFARTRREVGFIAKHRAVWPVEWCGGPWKFPQRVSNASPGSADNEPTHIRPTRITQRAHSPELRGE